MAKPTKTTWRRYLIAGLVVVGIYAIVVVALNLHLSNNKKSALELSNQFVNNLQANQLSEAYQLFIPEANASASEAQFTKEAAKLPTQLKGEEKVKNQSAALNIDGYQAVSTVNYSFADAEDKFDDLTVNLAKLDGRWYIQNFFTE